MLEANFCKINGKVERFASRTLYSGDLVELAQNFDKKSLEKSVHFDLIFENEFIKIVNKPAGFICSPESTKRAFGSHHFLVHRLDKDTTGLLILAKRGEYRDEVMELFKKREIEKSYLAIVDGVVQNERGTKKSYFVKKRAFEGQTIWGSSPHEKGLLAITHYERLKVLGDASLILCKPVTGRTHQIRVHLSEMGHPILIDPQYGAKIKSKIHSSRPLLHARALQFTYRNERIDVKAPIPNDFNQILSVPLL